MYTPHTAYGRISYNNRTLTLHKVLAVETKNERLLRQTREFLETVSVRSNTKTYLHLSKQSQRYFAAEQRFLAAGVPSQETKNQRLIREINEKLATEVDEEIASLNLDSALALNKKIMEWAEGFTSNIG